MSDYKNSDLGIYYISYFFQRQIVMEATRYACSDYGASFLADKCGLT